MNLFLFFLKRDLRKLLPVNIILSALLIISIVSLKFVQLRVGKFLDINAVSAIAFLLIFFSVFAVFIIIFEAFWVEWRKKTQYNWYLFNGSMHAKLLSKITAVYIWQWIQLIIGVAMFLVFVAWAGTPDALQGIKEEFAVLKEFSWQYAWSLVVVPVASIIPVLFGCLLFFGIKTWHKFVYVPIYIILVFICFPYLYIQLDINRDPVETEPFFFSILDVSLIQMSIDLLVALGLYYLMYWFLIKKLEL